LETLQPTAQQESSGGKPKTIHEIFDAKETHLDQYLYFDCYRKTSFLDHLLPDSTDLESFRRCLHQEEGDFIDAPYVIHDGKNGEILFSRAGNLLREEKHHAFFHLIDRK
jgi:hypothetical protein